MQILDQFKGKCNVTEIGFFRPFFTLVVFCALVNVLALKSAILGLILAVFWLIMASKVMGRRFFGNFSFLAQGALGLICLLIFIVTLGAGLFYTINFGLGAAIFLFTTVSFLTILFFDSSKDIQIKTPMRPNIKDLALLIAYCLLFIVNCYALTVNRSDEAILSPWEAVPKIFFVVYFLMTMVLIAYLMRVRSIQGDSQDSLEPTTAIENCPPRFVWQGRGMLDINLILLFPHFLLSFIVVVVVYRIGFGFDGFVHQAVETKFWELGYILPTPLHYLGQYLPVIFGARIFLLPIEWLDKLLTPLLAAISLPYLIYESLKKILNKKNILLIVVCLLLIVLTPLFYYSVPQSLANFLLLILILIIFNADRVQFGHWFWALAIFITHPLSGLPAVIALTLKHKNIKTLKQKYLMGAWVMATAVIIPLFFVLISFMSDFSVKFSFSNFIKLKELFAGNFSYLPFYSVYHLVYLFSHNWLIIIILFLLAGGYYLIKIGKKNLLIDYCLLIIVLLINLLLLGFLEFGAVIDYEQGEFIRRLWQIILLILTPLLAVGIYFVIENILRLKGGKLILIILLPMALTMALYLNYPHSDAFNKERGYSVSRADVAAVKWINNNAGASNYIVLSNQSTAAASLREFGFRKYFNKCQMPKSKCQMLFYYPIPTSSPLYDIYLKMVYHGPKMEYIEAARELTGAQTVYFVINNYWLDGKKRIIEAREIASEEWSYNNQIWVFKF